ncbi:MAG: addiction module protein [Gammaproteobacteria bacterium RIFCSPHIGHO2_12_FULL_35_23]|nr:MAG: addiction module protein [Gammaproteobacteria bacterium RIFCSPHIGHO2_12_FULL_35_23]
MSTSNYRLPTLPLNVNLDTVGILRAQSNAHRHLAELKGRTGIIPNQGILIDTLVLQEAKASSEIENIVTTQDELFQGDLLSHDALLSGPVKEVVLYRDALKRGYDAMQKHQGIITNNTLIELFQLLKGTTGGFRVTPGTTLTNQTTGEVVYIPPQDANVIVDQMTKLEKFVNEDGGDHIDPLVKMAIIHHQFESIHPFPDGNGRIGRILNVLYLVRSNLLEIPILYLSRGINRSKPDYYRLLQEVRDDNNWEGWIIYMLNMVAETAQITLKIIDGMRKLMHDYKQNMRAEVSKLYSQDLLNNLFRYPYTRIEYVQNDLGVSRQTAAKYLDQLASAGFLEKHQAGRNQYYINVRLIDLLLNAAEEKARGL